ncbi:MAG: hypothetical protein UZ22_OP11002000745 [Microgenomates bacterium OLB23]|nr:MAG: hypothetical protein UZ22_OP11002000745 [Microgenomates bacterium OLB23]
MNSKNLAVGLVVVAIIGVAVFTLGSKPTQNQQPTPTAQVEEITTEVAEYKDGTYEAIGNYTSPAQKEEIAIEVTLKDGVVTDAVFTGKAVNETSKKLQAKFGEGFKEEVVGKSLDEIALTVVNGSSLTPKGFMDALSKVKQDAQS